MPVIGHSGLARLVSLAAVLAAALAGGCATTTTPKPCMPVGPVPRELDKTTMPEYKLEAPDVLQIDLMTAVPKSPYHIRPLDSLAVRILNPVVENPGVGVFQVDPDGSVELGEPYGAVKVAGMTLEEARKAFREHLLAKLKNPAVDVSLAQTRGAQQVRGPHLIRPDGTVGLGSYGSVRVVGMTLTTAKAAIEQHLTQYFQDPEVALEVAGYNSKVYYVIFDGGGAGQQMSRVPITGNETVLDAVGQLSGLTVVSDAQRIWVARPGEVGSPYCMLPVNWKAITEFGDVQTNYQLLPGDRVFVQAYPLVALDTKMGRVFAPIERLLGITLLGTGLAQQFRNGNNNNNSNGFN